MLSFLIQAFEFLFRSLFDIAIFNFISLFVLQLVKANFFNPFSQFLLRVTNPVLMPARRYLPFVRNVDTACLGIAFILTLMKIVVLSFIQFQKAPNLIGLLLWTLGDMSSAILYFFFFAVLANVIISWTSQGSNSLLSLLLEQITTPLMRPFRKLLNPVAGFDLSPLLVMIGLQFLILLMASPLIQMGMALAFN